MKRIRDATTLSREVLAWYQDRGYQSSVSIAKYTKINQSQIFRALFKKPKRASPTLLKLCKLTSIDTHEEIPDPSKSEVLMEALGSVWDGTEDHAKRLAGMIFAIKQASVRE